MIKDLNVLIDINLKLLKEKENNSVFFDYFLNSNREPFSRQGNHMDATRLAKNMEDKGLIDIEKELAILTEFGYTIASNGGWSNHLIEQTRQNNEIEAKKNEKENLEQKNLILQNENFEYQKAIRDKQEQILMLTKDNLRLNNWDIRFRWAIAVVSFIIGLILKHYIDK